MKGSHDRLFTLGDQQRLEQYHQVLGIYGNFVRQCCSDFARFFGEMSIDGILVLFEPGNGLEEYGMKIRDVNSHYRVFAEPHMPQYSSVWRLVQDEVRLLDGGLTRDEQQ